MSLRNKLTSSLLVTGLVLGISRGITFAAETAKKAERGRPPALAQLSPGQNTSHVPVDFTITDVSMDGDRVTLHGQRRDGNGPISVTIPLPAAKPIGDSEAFARRVFARDDAH